ncbi:MAG: ABC transporter ATP-binding protein/permease [Defluviitaleaceae bacterium]|nr:ABC transporter ATP-binding protein/permease [Defluviitaleaceae bacterium]
MRETLNIIFNNTRTKLFILLYILTSIGSGFLLLYANDLLARLLNNYLMIQQFYGFAASMLLTTGVFTFVFLMNMLEAYLFVDLKWGTTTHLIGYYTARLLRSKQEFFTNLPASEIFSNLQLASQGSGEFFGILLRLASRTIIFVFFGVLVFRLDMWAGIFTVVALPIYFLFTARLGNQMAALEADYIEREGELVTVSQEALENVGNVKAKGAYDFFADRPNKVLEKIKIIAVKVGIFEHYTANIAGLFQIIAPILIIFGTIQLSPTFDTSAGSVMVLFINIPLFLGGFANIHSSYISYKILKPFLSKLQEFEDVPLEDNGGLEITSFESLRTEGVRATFEDGRNITVPDFNIKSGEKMMFFGESGVGKSTFFNIIMGFIPTYEGDIYVNDINIREIRLLSLRRVFGITFQHNNVLTLDLRSNILLGVEKSDEELQRLIKITTLDNQQDYKGETILNNKVLSGGEKSRLGLSQMLATSPEVLLIDEAFSNMDEELEAKILDDLFREYPNCTVICISHRNSSRPFFNKVVDFNILQDDT